LHQLQSSSDVVLIDTPPLGAIKDAVVLAECVDQIVLVARVGHTRRDALARCRAAVDQLGSPVLGIVTVGGPRGGALDYYFRPELDVSITQLSEPKLVAVRQRPSQPQPEAETQVETQVETLPSQQPPAAAAKGGRSRRRASADNSG
jgi:receptor protein-tyrosine kinase